MGWFVFFFFIFELAVWPSNMTVSSIILTFLNHLLVLWEEMFYTDVILKIAGYYADRI